MLFFLINAKEKKKYIQKKDVIDLMMKGVVEL